MTCVENCVLAVSLKENKKLIRDNEFHAVLLFIVSHFVLFLKLQTNLTEKKLHYHNYKFFYIHIFRLMQNDIEIYQNKKKNSNASTAMF